MTVTHEKRDGIPRAVVSERVLNVYVHDDAMMVVPRSDWLWSLRYQDEQEFQGADDRLLAASIGEDIRYLAMECTKDEAWYRLQQIRKAILAYDRDQ